MTLLDKLAARRSLVHVSWIGTDEVRVIERPVYAVGDIVAVGDHLCTVVRPNGVKDAITATRAGYIVSLLPPSVTHLMPGQVVASIEPLRLWDDEPAAVPWSKHPIAAVQLPDLPPVPPFKMGGNKKKGWQHDINFELYVGDLMDEYRMTVQAEALHALAYVWRNAPEELKTAAAVWAKGGAPVAPAKAEAPTKSGALVGAPGPPIG